MGTAFGGSHFFVYPKTTRLTSGFRIYQKHRFNAESVLLVEIMGANINNLFAVQYRWVDTLIDFALFPILTQKILRKMASVSISSPNGLVASCAQRESHSRVTNAKNISLVRLGAILQAKRCGIQRKRQGKSQTETDVADIIHLSNLSAEMPGKDTCLKLNQVFHVHDSDGIFFHNTAPFLKMIVLYDCFFFGSGVL